MEEIFDENGELEYAKTNIAKPHEFDAHQFAQCKKDVANVRIILLECMKDHVVSNLHGKGTPLTI